MFPKLPLKAYTLFFQICVSVKVLTAMIMSVIYPNIFETNKTGVFLKFGVYAADTTTVILHIVNSIVLNSGFGA